MCLKDASTFFVGKDEKCLVLVNICTTFAKNMHTNERELRQ